MKTVVVPATQLPSEPAPVASALPALPAELQPGKEGRADPAARAALRRALLGPASPSPILVEAALLALASDARSQTLARFVADCAVSGRAAAAEHAASRPVPQAIAQEMQRRLGRAAPPRAALDHAAELVCDRASATAKYLALDGSARRGVTSPGWIGVSGEDDPPHRPANVPASPLTAHDCTLWIPIEDPPSAPRPRRGVTLTLRYACRGPLDGTRPVVLLLHGHSSRLEETDALAEALLATTTCSVLALDLPSSGYSETIDPAVLVPDDTVGGDQALDFLDRTLDAFVHHVLGVAGHPTQKVACVCGGSLGGNLAIRAGARKPRWLGGRIAAWSPASVWSPTTLKLALDVPFGRSREVERDGSRADYFRQVFDERLPLVGGQLAGMTQPDTWYAPDWPGRDAAIRTCRAQRRETYQRDFRKWHWRVAYEQLLGSLTTPGTAPNGARIPPTIEKLPGTKVLLLAGREDDLEFTNIYARVAEIGPRLAQLGVVGTTLLLEATGHSIHDERPAYLAQQIAAHLNGALDG
ncbi:MAG: hypothetical protein OHK0013_25640 [Sandaracinaceae bacterium]